MKKANLLKRRDAKLTGLKLIFRKLQDKDLCHTCELRVISHGGWVARVRFNQALYFGVVFLL